MWRRWTLTFFQGIFQPCCRLDTVELGGGEQALYRGGPFAGTFATGKQPVLLTQRNRSAFMATCSSNLSSEAESATT